MQVQEEIMSTCGGGKGHVSLIMTFMHPLEYEVVTRCWNLCDHDVCEILGFYLKAQNWVGF